MHLPWLLFFLSQNMSGLNRQARQEDVLNDPKNRLVACYMGTIEHLQPGYLLIEQVRVCLLHGLVYSMYCMVCTA
jgi:site-specific DNA-cytosine methylase